MAKRSIGTVIICIALVAITAVCGVLGTITIVRELKHPVSESPLGIDNDDGNLGGTLDISGAVGTDMFSSLKVNTSFVTYPEGILDKYRAVYAVNQDVVGWLKVPNTPIDTIVIQGSDNSYYLKNNMYGKFTKYGEVFMDYRCNIKTFDRNTVLFGHTTYDYQQIFAGLYNYKDTDFYKTTPVIEFNTLFAEYKWKVFAVFFTTVDAADDNGYVFNYIRPSFSDSSFEGYLEQVNQRALYDTGVDVNASDKLLTLSTCAYDFGSDVDTRMVVVARLLRDGESEEVDTSKVVANSDYRRPQVWYDKHGQTNPYKNSSKWQPS